MLNKAKIVFTPSGKRGEFARGTSLLTAARALGVDLDSVCGGRGICGRCQVVPSFGNFPKFAIDAITENLSAENAVEQRYRLKKGLAKERRLGCNAQLLGDMVVDVPEDSQIHRQVIRKSADNRPMTINPIVRLYDVKVTEPDMHKPSGDSERLEQAVLAAAKQQGLMLRDEQVSINPMLLPTIQSILRQANWQVSALLRQLTVTANPEHDLYEIAYLWAEKIPTIYGLAIDLGSTTMSLHLTDYQTGQVVSSVGAMNPQIRFGEDLMSRVSYVMLNQGGDKELTDAVRYALNDLARRACQEVGVNPDWVVEICLVGNPVMHHLFLGINPTELGWAPFALATNHAVNQLASQVGFQLNPNARIYLLPCIAGHVGADAAAVLLSEKPWQDEKITLLVDVGTNAEIMLGNKDRLLACSSPTGPALEGAQISSGQRAASGAIEKVRIDKVTLEPKFRIIGSELWSDEPGFPNGLVTAEEKNLETLSPTGICGSGIIEAIAEMMLAGIVGNDGVIDGRLSEKNKRIVQDGRTFSYILHYGNAAQNEPEIRVTQADIRAIQLAKAALYAGCKLLIDKLGKMPEQIKLAGAFGNHIEPKYALLLGMIPNCAIDQIKGIGNAAGTGARVALLDKNARLEIEQHVRKVEKIETAIEAKFQEYFVAAMGIPNSVDEFPALAAVVQLPAKKLSNAAGGGRGNRVGRRRG